MHVPNSLGLPEDRWRVDTTYCGGFQQELKVANHWIFTHGFQTMKEQILTFQASHTVEPKPETTLWVSNGDQSDGLDGTKKLIIYLNRYILTQW